MERTNDEEFLQKSQPRTLYEDMCARGTTRRCNQNQGNKHVKTTGFFTNSWRTQIALESNFEEHAQEVWERNWMNPEMQTTLLNTYPSKIDGNDSEGAS